MAQHLIDTVPKLVTCTRCGAYVFTCHTAGVRVTVNPGPLTVEQYREALIAGRGTYDQIEQGGRPHKLTRRLPSTQWPPYRGRKVLADHGCGTQAMNVTAVETTDIPPFLARANGSDARASDAMSTVATHVIRRHSKREFIKALCDRCKRSIGEDYRFVGIEYEGYWQWVQHDFDCMKDPDALAPNSRCSCGVETYEIDGVSLDLSPVVNEDGLTTYSIFADKLKLRDETWRHPSTDHKNGSKHRGWSSWNPTSPAYVAHSCKE